MEENDQSQNQQQDSDIIDLILEHHKPLKALIKILKDTDADAGERFVAFEKFAPLLLQHAEPEEISLYEFMKQDDDLVIKGIEGETEHTLATQLIEEIYEASDENIWSAKIKVLAEMVEHHIKEEEQKMLPDFKENSDISERIAIGAQYMQLRNEMLSDISSTTSIEEDSLQVQ